jgi:hypothetical protein
MTTFIAEDGRRVSFIDWASVSAVRTAERGRLQLEPGALSEGSADPVPACIAANDLLDRNLLAFIQGLTGAAALSPADRKARSS